MRSNFIGLLFVFSIAYFSLFMFDFFVKYIKGEMVFNTLCSQFSVISGMLLSGIIYSYFGPRLALLGFALMGIGGSIIMIECWEDQ
mmetsp:Transcript_9614/g.16145  ORF Transcript_9614/g.16145 Transcript_9614/m.16145 type:complete len:86 (+) Transcript_9614:240-497(+)